MQGAHKGEGVWQDGMACGRLPASTRKKKSVKIYVDCRFPFANSSLCCLLLSGPAAFLSNCYSLSHKPTTSVLKALAPHVGTDPEVNPQWRQTPAWECHELWAGDWIRTWEHRGPAPSEAQRPTVLKGENSTVGLHGHFTSEEIDLAFWCVVSIEAGLNLLSEDYKAT